MRQAIFRVDVAVIGGGQAGLACGYFLRRTGLRYAILDAEPHAGGAWQHMWRSLHTFSPARWSSLPGWPMPSCDEDWPPRDHVVDYLQRYELHYRLPVYRPVTVETITRGPHGLRLHTSRGEVRASAVISATGTWRHPYVPHYPDQEVFQGHQLHTVDYDRPEMLRGQRVLVVGGGNSGAQILAEVSREADATWVTSEPPHFLPDDVDGRVLFERATSRWEARQAGREETPVGGLGDIVMVPSVKDARARGALHARRPFSRFTARGVVWPDAHEETIDTLIWCTGFRPALDHLAGLNLVDGDGRVAVEGTRARDEPRLWLVGYGEWTGFASATLIGVLRSARSSVREIAATLGTDNR